MATSDKYKFSPGNRGGNSYIYTQKGTYDCPPGSTVITAACKRLDKFEQEAARTGEYRGANRHTRMVGRTTRTRGSMMGMNGRPRRAARNMARNTRGGMMNGNGARRTMNGNGARRTMRRSSRY
jgi:hypothetical protein